MKIKSFLKHSAIVVLAIFILLGIPFLTSDYFKSLVSGTDAMSSASAILDAPSGNYIVLINRSLHTDAASLSQWEDFFQGEDEIIFEDISCSVANGDTGGITMAQSYQSRLPENQMKVQTEASVMMLSRLANDEYDVIVMSSEFADSYHALDSLSENTVEIEVKGETDAQS